MRMLIDGFILAIQFFTPLPISKEVQWEEKRARYAVMWLPFIGLCIGLLLAGIAAALQWTAISPLAVSILLLFFMTALTGGLHLDGWMDSADAYFSFRDRQRRLEIMSDPRTGAFGVLAVIFLLLFRWLFLYEMIINRPQLIGVLLILIPAIIRLAMVYLLCFTTTAKESGLAFHFQQHLKDKDAAAVSIAGIAVLFIAAAELQEWLLLFILVIAALIFTVLTQRFVKRAFGGITGDTLGAFIEGGELILWMSVWLLLSLGMV